MENQISHNTFNFPDDNVVISSDFDSGNLQRAEKQEGNKYFLWVCTDAPNSNTKSWFYFLVHTSIDSSLKFCIKNIGNLTNLYKFGLRPVFSYDRKIWERIETDFEVNPGQDGLELTFSHNFTQEIAFFAFTYPWSYEDNQTMLESINRSDLYIFRTNLISSLENRRCDLLAISSNLGITEVDLTFPGLKLFENKEMIFISARVHAAETASSYAMNGIIKFLLSDDPRAVALLDTFVFILVPKLNPDGVFKGNMRLDPLGHNLNRFYTNPIISLHPTIYAVKEFIVQNKERVYCYIDLHAHASIKGVFVFGNYMNDFKKQVEACMFARLMTLNCANFHWDQCNFSDENMKAHDKSGESREGSGRVGIYQATGLIRCYTLECNYHSGIIINQILSSGLNDMDHSHPLYTNGPPAYNIAIFEDVGKNICVSLLDLVGKNEFSRIKNTEFGNLENFKLSVAEYVSKIVPYRYFNDIRKAGKNRELLAQLISDKPIEIVSEDQKIEENQEEEEKTPNL